MIRLRKAAERGHSDLGWLDSYHTFSFNTYHDKNHMGFRSLRVINDDRVQPGRGFGSHPHRDMEIISYVLEGALEHKDNMGNGSIIRPGDIQRLSAGAGIVHSEFNHSQEEPVHFLQIWITPRELGLKPSYQEATFSREDKLGKLRLIASGDGRDGSVTIHQDANIYATILEKDMEVILKMAEERYVWIQVARGEARLGEMTLSAGDGVAVSGQQEVRLTGVDDSEMLIFDLA